MSMEETDYRLRMAQGFLGEARHNIAHDLWRSCVDNSQLAAENAAKAVLSLLGPVGRTHDPGALLLTAVEQSRFPQTLSDVIEQLAEHSRTLGPQVHIESDYGDEASRRTPWELFDRESAERALSVAGEAVAFARRIIEAEPAMPGMP